MSVRYTIVCDDNGDEIGILDGRADSELDFFEACEQLNAQNEVIKWAEAVGETVRDSGGGPVARVDRETLYRMNEAIRSVNPQKTGKELLQDYLSANDKYTSMLERIMGGYGKEFGNLRIHKITMENDAAKEALEKFAKL